MCTISRNISRFLFIASSWVTNSCLKQNGGIAASVVLHKLFETGALSASLRSTIQLRVITGSLFQFQQS